MQSGTTDESVGEQFDVDLLKLARDKTLQVIVEAARQIRAGMTELDAKRIIASIQSRLGAEKSWHPPQIRFAENTLLPFGKVGQEPVVLKDNDIFFFDIGPIFEGHEGDVGRPFFVGTDLEMKKCCEDAEAIWFKVQEHWSQNNVTGSELYEFASQEAKTRGWLLALEKANGHRVADFPHIARARGSIEGFGKKPEANLWILEIQIRHPTRAFGAFYEDLLN
jgi:Xaa-Pro aminopeptidase